MPVIRRNTSNIHPTPMPVTKSMTRVLRPRILHSSISPFGRAEDVEFPSFPRAIGVIVRAEKRSTHAPETIFIEQEWPTLTSIVHGEESDSENVEKLTREKIRELVARCRTIAQELLSHANRLDSRLKDNQLLDSPQERTMSRLEENPQDRARRYQPRWGEHDVMPTTRQPTRDKAPKTSKGGKSTHTSQRVRRPPKHEIDVAKLSRALEDDEDGD